MATQRTFRAGLIGAGHIAEFHLAAIKRLPQVEIVGICDADPARAQAFAAKHGIAALATPATLQAAGADVLHVLTPPHTHAALTIEALNLGCHVLVEKPLTEDVADCDRITAAATAADRRVCVGHSLLFDPQVQRALTDVRNGAIGRVVSVDILRSSVYPTYGGGPLPPRYRSAGYPFRDLGVHCLYLLEALLGPIENVQAQWQSLGGDPNLAYDEWRAQVRCRDGLGQFQLSWNTKPVQSQIVIHGTSGVLRVDLFLWSQARRGNTPLPKAVERIWHGVTDAIKPSLDLAKGVAGFALGKVLPYHGVQALVEAFYASLAEGSAAPVSVEDARRVVEWTEQIARAADAEHRQAVDRFTLADRVPVLVTGASGGVGAAIAARLLDEGRRVRLMVRRIPADLPQGVEIALGDLGDPAAVDRAVNGAEIVIHAGAAMKGNWTAHECGTIAGTRNIVDACRRHGVKKLVHISSMSVVDWAGAPGEPLSESSPLEPRANERGSYTRAKLEAERIVRESDLPAVVLRPGQIFGGKIPLLTGAVARKKGSRWIVLGDGHARLPLVYLDDVVDAVVAAADGSLADRSIIQLVDNVTPTQRELLAMVVQPGESVRSIPLWLLTCAAAGGSLVFKCLRRPSPATPYRFRSALAHRTFRSENAHLLGWKPRVGATEGIRRTLGRPINVPAMPVQIPDDDAVMEAVS